jgi:hypothetical protein
LNPGRKLKEEGTNTDDFIKKNRCKYLGRDRIAMPVAYRTRLIVSVTAHRNKIPLSHLLGSFAFESSRVLHSARRCWWVVAPGASLCMDLVKMLMMITE